MSALEREDLLDKIERTVLRLMAQKAQSFGIDITKPGWGDEFEAVCAENRKRNREPDAMIATPYVDEAIDRMEQQFEEGSS